MNSTLLYQGKMYLSHITAARPEPFVAQSESSGERKEEAERAQMRAVSHLRIMDDEIN